jgi:geranylgeranyl diphosphate synthase type I
MDIFTSTLDVLHQLPLIQSWVEMRALLKRIAARKPRHWNLPVSACEAVGGTSEQAIPAAAAIACLHTGILLIDDLLDGDPRGEFRTLGAPATANLAAAFQAAALEVIAHHASADVITKLVAPRSLNHAALATALGQYLDSQNPVDEAAYWRVVQAKSAPFFGAALQVGALLGGAPAELAEQLRQFGSQYGEMIQIHDDLKDALAAPANPDWALGRAPLPILFALVVDHPDRARFRELRRVLSRATPDPEALAEAQNILIRCGAVSYGVHHLLARYQTAQQTLKRMPLMDRTGLEALLEDLIRPVEELFQAVGIAPPDAGEAVNWSGEDQGREAERLPELLRP